MSPKATEEFQKWWDENGIHWTPGSDPMYDLNDWADLFRCIYFAGWNARKVAQYKGVFNHDE